MISINGLELDPYLQVPDWYTSPRAAGVESTSLFGVLMTQRLALSSRPITLTARQDGSRLLGHFKRSHVEALRLLAESGEAVPFVYHDKTVNVVVSLAGLAVEMVGYRTDPPVNHPFVGTITLYEV